MLSRSLYKNTSHLLCNVPGQRFYATSRKPSFWYSYGTPLFNLLLWSSTTTLAFHLLWHKLDYAEFKKGREDEIKDLEHRIKNIQESTQA
jgi:hypothetical protein